MSIHQTGSIVAEGAPAGVLAIEAPLHLSGAGQAGAEFDPTFAMAARTGPAGSGIKRVVDLLIAACALFFMAPLFALVALAIKLDSRGPVFFIQRRTGLGGAPIRVLKFRSMRVQEDGDVVRHAERNDSRVTRVGQFLRRSSIDELPQLINVVRGEMSLVGPRPHALAHDQKYAALLPAYGARFRCRPGITGLAQVSGYRGEIRVLGDMEGRVTADNHYIETWTPWLDAKILAKTVVVAPFQSTAY